MVGGSGIARGNQNSNAAIRFPVSAFPILAFAVSLLCSPLAMLKPFEIPRKGREKDVAPSYNHPSVQILVEKRLEVKKGKKKS